MVWGGGGGKAPKAPKVVDFKVFPKNSWIHENFMKLLLVSCFLHSFMFSCKGVQVDAWNTWKGIVFIRFLSRRGKMLEITENRILGFCKQKSLISRSLHENDEIAGNRGWSPPKSLKTLRNYNGSGKGWRRGWKWWYFGEINWIISDFNEDDKLLI